MTSWTCSTLIAVISKRIREAHRGRKIDGQKGRDMKKKAKKKAKPKPGVWSVTTKEEEVEIKTRWYMFVKLKCPRCGRIVEAARVSEDLINKCSDCVSRAWSKVPDMVVVPTKRGKVQCRVATAQMEMGILMTRKKKTTKKKHK